MAGEPDVAAFADGQLKGGLNLLRTLDNRTAASLMNGSRKWLAFSSRGVHLTPDGYQVFEQLMHGDAPLRKQEAPYSATIARILKKEAK